MIILVSAALCAGCSDEEEPADTGLVTALARVAADDNARGYVEYGDVARIAALTDRGDDRGKRFLSLAGYGFSPIATTTRLMADELGFDPLKMDGAVLAGEPPHQAGVLWGDYDVDALDRELAGRDIPSDDSGDGTRWTVAGDLEIELDGPLAGIARASELNDLHTAPREFAYATSRAGLGSVTEPGDRTLADDESTRRIAGCLGDVAAAVIAKMGDDPVTYGVGVRVTSGGDVTEVACLLPDGDAPALRGRVERELADGTTPSSRQPWRELLPHASVAVVELGSVVRIEAKPGPDDAVGRVMQLLQTRDLAALAEA
jgi:hypothetical protein